MVVNDDAGHLIPRGVPKSIASKLAPTGGGALVSGGLGVKVQHAHPRQQIRFRQVRMLMPAQGAIHQPVAVLNVESEAADEGLLFFAGGDEVETILVFGVKHDVVRVGFEARMVADSDDEAVTQDSH